VHHTDVRGDIALPVASLGPAELDPFIDVVDRTGQQVGHGAQVATLLLEGHGQVVDRCGSARLIRQLIDQGAVAEPP
jgi:hypothetical protein